MGNHFIGPPDRPQDADGRVGGAWFDHPHALTDAPPLFRVFVRYNQVVSRATGRVRGSRHLLRAIRWLTARFGLPREVGVHVNGLTRVLDLCDRRLLWAIEEARDATGEAAAIREGLSEGDTFLDIGANCGGYALLAATLVGPRGRVVACEPQPRLAAALRKSFEANRFSHGEVHELACGDRHGTVDLYVPEWSGAAGLYRQYSGRMRHERIAVPMATLDELIDWERLPGRVFLKLDVEGSELRVLRGATRLIRARAPAILFEVNPESAHAAGFSGPDLLRFLGTLGYDRFAEVDRHSPVLPAGDVDCSHGRSLLALPPSSRASSPRTRSSRAGP